MLKFLAILSVGVAACCPVKSSFWREANVNGLTEFEVIRTLGSPDTIVSRDGKRELVFFPDRPSWTPEDKARLLKNARTALDSSNAFPMWLGGGRGVLIDSNGVAIGERRYQ